MSNDTNDLLATAQRAANIFAVLWLLSAPIIALHAQFTMKDGEYYSDIQQLANNTCKWMAFLIGMGLCFYRYVLVG